MAKTKTFEEQMDRLEEIVSLLEKGDAPLADSMKLFEEGVKLADALGGILEKAEQSVKMMTADANGELTEVPFESEEA